MTTTTAANANTSATASEAGAWRDNLALVQQLLPFTRRGVHAGDTIYEVGAPFGHLHLINSGQFKTVNSAADGRGQVVGLHFRGDWLGFDGIAQGRYACDAVALDTGEVWSVRYADLLTTSAASPVLMRMMHAAMSRQIGRGSDTLLSLGTLPADARVADFIKDWAQSLATRGLRADQITLHMTRAEIGNYLGMTLETVSRALRRLAQCGVIRFDEKGRRDLAIPSLAALDGFIRSAHDQRSAAAGSAHQVAAA